MLDFAKGGGLIPAIIQDDDTGEVLTLAYMNEESLRRTRESGQVWFYSRSRQELWHKGATSGNFLNVRRILRDCDDDTLLIRVQPAGPACHTGERSCFYRDFDGRLLEGPNAIGDLLSLQTAQQRLKSLVILLRVHSHPTKSA